MDAAGMVVGGVSLAIQLLDGIVKGFVYFESASNAETEYFACRTKLAIEYSRLQRWAIRSCLVEESARSQFESRTKHNRYMIIAILTQLDRKLKDMRKVMLDYENTIDPEKRDMLREFSNAITENQNSLNDVSEVKVIGSTTSAGVDEILNQTSVASGLTDDELDRYNIVTGNVSGVLPAVNTIRGFRHLKSWGKGTIKIAKQPKRCKWAFKDKVKFDDHLAEVRELVDGLIGSLEHDQMEQVMRDVRDIRLILLATARTADGARALQQPTQVPLEGSTLVPDTQNLSLENVPATVANERRFNVFYQKVTSFFVAITSGEGPLESYLEAARLEYDKTAEGSSPREDILLDGKPAWIEWKAYTAITGYDEARRKPTSGPSPIIEMRAARLGALLRSPEKPAEFCVPPFAGVLKDSRNRRFGFVYQPPVDEQIPGPTKRTSLHERLLGKQASLYQRIEIAQQLSQWLLYLHCVSWLHKNIRSESVLFFPGSDKTSPSRAYVTGFEYARLVDSQSVSQNFINLEWALYTHPDYINGQNNGFRKTYDMYSLGVVLVELAYWRPVLQILGFGPAQQLTLDSIMQARRRLLDPEEGHLEHVESVMGGKYARATRVCLEGMEAFGLSADKDQGDRVISGLLQQAFIRMVVDPLHDVSV